ncbi:M20/M25/M40 family metallo-hydrolase [Lacticaseibacillus zhaodongensis]|uniref:M20/M25/M40 family metallo-hydrolase n=1 Tax=Lacticaseibacillus zhaodongensis TaxID=2668065 RepID=UPI0012D349E4|nr:M20/M25/M40 family metallo-hydrolase [Lacticaseibacillus zhaodongensis]
MSRQDEIEQFAEDYFPQVTDYQRIPSVSAEGTGIKETAAWLQRAFSDLGAETVTAWDDQGGNPVVFAEFKWASDKTVLFYNHYDVQPPAPLDEWNTEPFEPTRKGDQVFGRGISDDKGELMSRLTALRYMKDHGGFPVNMKFMVEGEEEIGSIHVAKYVHAHAAELTADVCIWEGGGKNELERFTINLGVKGIVSFDMAVKTADYDLHSSMGAYADNAAWRLVEAMNSLRDPQTKRVLVDGFYDGIEELSAETKQAIEAMDFDADTIKTAKGLKRPFITADPKMALVNAPTMTINGLTSGYEGEGVKTIIPKYARAKFDCRLVPGQDPQDIFAKIRKQLDKNGYEDVELHFILGEDAYRSDISDAYVQAAKGVADEVYGAEHTGFEPNSAGSGPEAQFAEDLHVPIISVGIGWSGAGAHAPNESIRMSDYRQGTYYMVRLLEEFGK